MTKLSSIIAVAILTLGLGSCDSTALAYGDVNSIIAVMRPELWDEVSEDVYSALEPTIRTVRDEKTFTVTYQDPLGDLWESTPVPPDALNRNFTGHLDPRSSRTR